MPFRVGQHVRLKKALLSDPYIFQIRRYGNIVEARPDGYMIDLPCYEDGYHFGPFTEDRLAAGWYDDADRPR